MDFTLTSEQEELVRTLRGFAKKELAPRSSEWDRSGEFPWDAWKKMGELGLLGLRTPAAYGGQEADLLTMGIASEEIARGDFSCTYGIQLAGLAGEILGKSGSDEMKARWLPSTARGDTIVALALTEPGVGSDAANLSCRAVRDGDAYLITGEKSGISLGMVAQAAIVFARTDADAKARGVTASWSPSIPGIREAPSGSGTRAIARAVLSFDHVRVPASHRIGAEGTGFYQVMQGFDYNRVLIALSCLGVAQISLEETMTYVKERRTFGRALATYEGVSFPIAEAATHVDACRLLSYRALWLADRSERYTKESAMVKWWGPKLSVETIHQCLLLHGHYGYTDELPFRAAPAGRDRARDRDGTAEIMKVVVAVS
jgi:cyclohexanecarboxyl-CoA dehydrogenase